MHLVGLIHGTCKLRLGVLVRTVDCGFNGIDIGSQILAIGTGVEVRRSVLASRRLIFRPAQSVVPILSVVVIYKDDGSFILGGKISGWPMLGSTNDGVMGESKRTEAVLQDFRRSQSSGAYRAVLGSSGGSDFEFSCEPILKETRGGNAVTWSILTSRSGGAFETTMANDPKPL